MATLVWPENEPRIYQILSKTNPLIFVSNQARTKHVLKPCLAASTYDSSHSNSKSCPNGIGIFTGRGTRPGNSSAAHGAFALIADVRYRSCGSFVWAADATSTSLPRRAHSTSTTVRRRRTRRRQSPPAAHHQMTDTEMPA